MNQSREIIFGALIAWCTIFSSSGQSAQPATISQNIIATGSMPEVFLQEGVSTPNNESAPTFTPDGNTVYFEDGRKICFSEIVEQEMDQTEIGFLFGTMERLGPMSQP